MAPFNVTIHGTTKYLYGDTLELYCTSEGDPDLQYSWSRETSSGNTFPAGTTISNNTISITNLSISDGGRYTCTVSNEAGDFSSTITVDVDGKQLYYNVHIAIDMHVNRKAGKFNMLSICVCEDCDSLLYRPSLHAAP